MHFYAASCCPHPGSRLNPALRRRPRRLPLTGDQRRLADRFQRVREHPNAPFRQKSDWCRRRGASGRTGGPRPPRSPRPGSRSRRQGRIRGGRAASARTSAWKRAPLQPAAMTRMRESSPASVPSKSITAASTREAKALSACACSVAPVIEPAGPAVRSAPAPIRYSSIPQSWGGRVPTGWRTTTAPSKDSGVADP